MSMKLEVGCAMCGKEKTIRVDVEQCNGTIDAKGLVESNGWITQQNGDNFDIYCSKRCAQ